MNRRTPSHPGPPGSSLILVLTIASLASTFYAPLCAFGRDDGGGVPPVDQGDSGQLNPVAVNMLRDAGVNADHIVLAMRKVDGDGHWYANFGWDSWRATGAPSSPTPTPT